MFCGHLKRLCILLLSGIFFKYQLDFLGWSYGCVLSYACWFSIQLFSQFLRKGCCKSPAIILELPFFPFQFYQFWLLMYLQYCCLVHRHLGLLRLFGILTTLSLHNFPFYLVIFLALKSFVICYQYSYSCFLLINVFMIYLFPYFHFQPAYNIVFEISCL